MKRLLIAATLALGALAGSDMQARANGGGGKVTFGIGLNLTFSFGYTCADACPPNYGWGTPIPYPSCQSCQGGYAVPQYAGYDNGGGTAPAQPASFGYGNYPMFTASQPVYAVAE